MILAARLVYEFDLRYNRLQSSHDQYIRLEDKLSIINQGLRIVYKDLIQRAELESYYRNALRPLEVKEDTLKLAKKAESYNIYEYPQDIYKLMRMRITATHKDCPEKTIPVSFFQTDDLDNSMVSNFWKPSYAWELCLGDEGRDGYYLWHGGDYSIKKVYCDYYLKPAEIHAPSMAESGEYIDWNGIKQTKDVGLELDSDFVFDRIIDVAILVAKSIKGDVQDFNLALNKILQTDKISN